MKFKKLAASIAAAAMAVSSMAAMSVSAITAGATSIDFEDGDYAFVYMNTDSGADKSVLSVEDYNGSKRLKVDVQDKKMVPKVWFDLDKIMDRANTVQIRKITFDLTLVPKTAEGFIGWAGGAVGAAGGFDPNAAGSGQVDPSWSDKAWDSGAYDPGAVAEVKIERKFLMANEFYTEKGKNPFFGLMRWAAADDADNYVMYIDNIEFFDADGKNIAVGVTPPAEETTAAPEETTAAPEETTAAAADDEAIADDGADAEEEVAAGDDDAAVPEETAAAVTEAVVTTTAAVADTTTTAAATGNVAVASVAAVMAVAGAVAIASKKRK